MIVEELLSFHRLEKSLYNYKAIAQKLTNSSNYLEPLLRKSFDFYLEISRKTLTSAILNKYPSLKESSENNLSIRKFINKFINQTLASYIKDNIKRGFYQERTFIKNKNPDTVAKNIDAQIRINKNIINKFTQRLM